MLGGLPHRSYIFGPANFGDAHIGYASSSGGPLPDRHSTFSLQYIDSCLCHQRFFQHQYILAA